MNQDLSILHLVVNASFIVQLVMLVLLVGSITSWAAIFRKLRALKIIKAQNDEFERDFWSGTSLNDLYASAAQNAKHGGPMERIFASGMREYQKLRERRIADAGTLLDGARRAMRASYQRELDAAEVNLSFLASVGSVSPYVGLFGTVWGIMHAFTGLGALQQASASKPHTAPLERIFGSGMREFMKLRERHLDAAAQLDGARRAMRASYQRELDVVESNLSFLASVGSVSPYVGLFGTVWGIMHAFVGLSNMQQVTLATVAPGIAEALVATAIGLFAAIPAVIAYNRLSRDIDRIAIQLETFIEEFSNILQRSASQPALAAAS